MVKRPGPMTVIEVTETGIGHGIAVYACFADEVCCPVGFVWGIGYETSRKKRFDVMGSYVPPVYRRRGVRTAINEKILEEYDVISTLAGSPLGRAFMRAQGYKYDPRIPIWYKERKHGSHKQNRRSS